jgi:hypothetical protein
MVRRVSNCLLKQGVLAEVDDGGRWSGVWEVLCCGWVLCVVLVTGGLVWCDVDPEEMLLILGLCS